MFSVSRFDGAQDLEPVSVAPGSRKKGEIASAMDEGILPEDSASPFPPLVRSRDEGARGKRRHHADQSEDEHEERRHRDRSKPGKEKSESAERKKDRKMSKREVSAANKDSVPQPLDSRSPEDVEEQTQVTGGPDADEKMAEDSNKATPEKSPEPKLFNDQAYREPQKAKIQKRLVNLSERVEKSIEEDCMEWGIHSFLLERLRLAGMKSFFPIQRQAIPGILRTEGLPTGGFGVDICVSAPTGSGKTLVYVLPIIQTLAKRVLCRLRALIVVPSRDLAIQVKSVFDHYCAGSQLVVGLAIGQSNFADEQMELVGVTGYETSQGVNAAGTGLNVATIEAQRCGGSSRVDILVATPGRLIDHLRQTPGFTLQHLHFLVVDEADRLLNQSYSDWVAKVYESAYGKTPGTVRTEPDDSSFKLDPASIRSRPVTDADATFLHPSMAPPFRRLLFSATLTRNPKKLAALGLLYPQFYTTTRDHLADDPTEQKIAKSEATDTLDFLDKPGGRSLYSTPEGLNEYMLLCDTGEKPLILIHLLLRSYLSKRVIVFTSSVESTHRLARLLQLYLPAGTVGEYSSQLAQVKRTRLLQACRDGRVKVLICSDAMARGMDLQMECVINYDMPTYVKTYIHRVGRTARAGKEGTCVTLLRKGQEKVFRTLLKKVDNNYVRHFKVERTELKALAPRYVKCLDALKIALEEEQEGSVVTMTAPLQPLPGVIEASSKELVIESLL